MIGAPCKDCKDRKIGCHSDCDKYKEWQVLHKMETYQVRREKEKHRLMGRQ